MTALLRFSRCRRLVRHTFLDEVLLRLAGELLIGRAEFASFHLFLGCDGEGGGAENQQGCEGGGGITEVHDRAPEGLRRDSPGGDVAVRVRRARTPIGRKEGGPAG